MLCACAENTHKGTVTMATAMRVGRLLGSSLRASWNASRAYSNGAPMVPLTFGSPSEVRNPHSVIK